MPIPAARWTLDAWTAPAPAGGTRTSFLAESGGRAVFDVQRTRSLQPGESQLTFRVAPDHHALADLAPQFRVLRLTTVVPTGPDTFETRITEYRVTRRGRQVRQGVGPYAFVAVPLEEDLLDVDLGREVGSGGVSTWRFGVTEQTPTAVLTLLRDRLIAIGYTWVDVGTVTPTTPVTFELLGTATPRAIITALIAALEAKGVPAEFQFTLASDLSEYRLELPTQVASSMAALAVTTDANVTDATLDEDALEQATTVIPFGADRIDLRDLVFRAASVDGATGWITIEALDESDAVLVAVDDQYNGKRLFRELTGRSFAITDSSASPQRVRVAVADLASGLAAGETFSFRETEDNAGLRRYVTERGGEVPVQVVSTLTAPNRIRTRVHGDLGGGNWMGAANHLRDWTAERSQFIEELGSGTLNLAAGTFVLDAPPTNTPAVGDWILWHLLYSLPAVEHVFFATPCTVTGYDAGTRTISFERRYPGTQMEWTSSFFDAGAYLYRPVGTPMWIQSSAVTNNELTVDALPGPAFAATDVLEIRQRCQGTRLVELTDPTALAAARRKVATVEVGDCSGATNRVTNGNLAAWAGGAGDPPDGWSIGSISGTVTRTRTTDPLFTRYGGKSWKLDFAAAGSAEVYSPLIPVHPVVGADQVSCAVALLFSSFSGTVPLIVTLYAVTPAGVRTALGEPVRIYPPDTTVDVEPELKAAIDVWYDAVIAGQSVADLRDEVLQLGVQRPAGASNLACVVYLDAALCCVREGLPEAEEGGVRWFFHSDATRMLAAGNDVLLERAYPLVRYETQLLDLFRLDAAGFAPWELVLGRTVTLTIPPLGLTRSVRLLALTERLDDARVTQVTLHRLRPHVARVLAAELARKAATLPTKAPPPVDLATLSVLASYDDDNFYLSWSGSPTVTLQIDGAPEATPSASPITVARGAANTEPREYLFIARSGKPGDVQREVRFVLPRKYVPSGAPEISVVDPTITDAPGDGGGTFDLDLTVANMPGGTTYNVYATVLSGPPISSGTYTDDTDTLVIGDFPLTGLSGCAMAPGAQLQVRVEAWNAGVMQDSKTVTVTAP